MSPKEEGLLAAVRSSTHARESAAVVALLGPEIDCIVSGGGSREFTGMAFDAYCRSLLASHGHTQAVRLRIQDLCEKSRRRFGDQSWTYLYEGCLLHLGDEDEAAAACYGLASRDVDVLWPSSIGCRSVVGPGQREKFLLATAKHEAVRFESAAAAGDHVLFAACDHTYLRRFAQVYVKSAAKHGGNCTLHFHVINPAADDLDWLKQQAAEFWIRLSVSTEEYAGPDARAYFALARFLHVAQLLEFYSRPILVTDIDAAFTGDVEIFFATINAPHVGLRFKRQNFHAHPWNTIQAGAVLIRPTWQGLSFARDLRTISASLFTEKAGSGIWFIDQNILFSIYRKYHRSQDWEFSDLNSNGLRNYLTFGKDL